MDFVRRRLSQGGSDDEKSLSSSFSEGTSRFFSSMRAKKNGLMTNLSNKLENVMKTSSDSDSVSSDEPLPAQTTRFSSADAYNYGTNVLYDSDPETQSPRTRHSSSGNSDSDGGKEIIHPRPVNMSFEEPLYSPTLKNEKFNYIKTNSVEVKKPVNHTVQPNATNHEIKADVHASNLQCIGIKKVNNADVDPTRKPNVNGIAENENSDDSNGVKKPPKLKRRSSTVDEMLFDDYVAPAEEEKDERVEESRDTVGEDLIPKTRKTIAVMGDLISFDDTEPDENENLSPRKRSQHSSVSSTNSSDINYFPGSMDSSETEYGDYQIQRSESMGSENSWTSSYSVDSQPDDLTLECIEFMKHFVEMIFDASREITQTEKAKFGELCQFVPGRLWFARYVNSQRVHSKMVIEQIFFRLVQYFAVVLFECNEAEDFSPAKSLMNMCFTFYYQVSYGKVAEKNFLYSFLCDQPIWQSLRFWNAAYFDAVQCERARRPVTTRNDAHDDQRDDRMFQENITFGQLGWQRKWRTNTNVSKIYDYYEKYLTALGNRGYFYRRPLARGIVRYGEQVVGVNKIKGLMKEITTKTGLQGNYTNHSGKRTCATQLYIAGIPEQEIMARTGHRTETAVRNEEVSQVLNPPSKVVKSENNSESEPMEACSSVITNKKVPLSALKDITNQKSVFNNCVFNF